MPASVSSSDAVVPAGLGSAAEFDLAQFAKPCDRTLHCRLACLDDFQQLWLPYSWIQPDSVVDFLYYFIYYLIRSLSNAAFRVYWLIYWLTDSMLRLPNAT